jgi:hypothetical protein
MVRTDAVAPGSSGAGEPEAARYSSTETKGKVLRRLSSLA